jgi:predicted ATPase
MDHLSANKGGIAALAHEAGSQTYFYPISTENKIQRDSIFEKLAGGSRVSLVGLMDVEVIEGRSIHVKGYDKIAFLDFVPVFDKGVYGASDFIALTVKFEAILLKNIPQIGLEDRNMARRFILFVIFQSIGQNYF